MALPRAVILDTLAELRAVTVEAQRAGILHPVIHALRELVRNKFDEVFAELQQTDDGHTLGKTEALLYMERMTIVPEDDFLEFAAEHNIGREPAVMKLRKLIKAMIAERIDMELRIIAQKAPEALRMLQ